MLPIGPLMIEHRLIERMIALLDAEKQRMVSGAAPNAALVADAVDFLRTYADRCHHGKEEGILFRDLAARSLPADLKQTMDDLSADHVLARETVSKLDAATARLRSGAAGAVGGVGACIGVLVKLYPAHIAREDKQFFVPAMKCFTPEEQDVMLREFYEFDRAMIHEKYRGVVAKHERGTA